MSDGWRGGRWRLVLGVCAREAASEWTERESDTRCFFLSLFRVTSLGLVLLVLPTTPNHSQPSPSIDHGTKHEIVVLNDIHYRLEDREMRWEMR